MTKLSRKLLLSIVTVALALVTLGATTFAWFTLSTRAEVEGFEVDVTSGAGIEISADGMNYSNYIKANDIYAAINRAGSSTVLDHVTSPNGISFKTIGFSESDGKVHFDKDATSGWTEFKLWFRSPEEGVKVYMLDNTTVTSTGIDWVADAVFKLKSTDNSPTAVGAQYTLYGANAVRISTTENTVTPIEDSGFSYTNGTDAKVFELGYKDKGDQKLGQDIQTEYGSVAYYNTKNPTNQITTTHIQKAILPTVYGYDNLPKLEDLNTSAITDAHVPVDTLTAASKISGTTLYYGQITVRIWLEGWDPDMFNAIMADKIKIHLFFGGHSPSSLLSISTGDVSSLDLKVGDTQSITVTVEGYTGEIWVYSSDPKVATAEVTIDQETETTQVTVTAVGEGEAKITIYLQEYPGVTKEIPVTVNRKE